MRPHIKGSHLAILIALGITSAFVMFYHLGANSLHPWDEAWYATISRNLARSGNMFDLKFNQTLFWDHPPLGFYLEALSFKLLGFTSFAARLPQALLGVATVLLCYITGKKLTNQWLGIISALILVSSRWFLFRARTGNLDILLVFSQLLFFYLAYTSRERKKLWPAGLALGLSLTTKSAISLTLSPLLLLAAYELKKQQLLNWKVIGQTLLALFLPLLPWYGYNTIVHGFTFLRRNIFEIGLRKGSTSGVSLVTVNRTLQYFHAAVHKWYKLFFLLLGGFGVLAIIDRKKISRPYMWLSSYLFLTSFPYFLSAHTEIWHLIPIIVPMSLVMGFSLGRLFDKLPFSKILTFGAVLIFLIISITNIVDYWPEFINIDKTVSEPARISQRISDKQKNLYLTSDEYFPTIVFYSDLSAPVRLVRKEEFTFICETNTNSFRYLTDQNFVQTTKNGTVLDQEGPFILVEYDPQTCGLNNSGETGNL